VLRPEAIVAVSRIVESSCICAEIIKPEKINARERNILFIESKNNSSKWQTVILLQELLYFFKFPDEADANEGKVKEASDAILTAAFLSVFS
jgi:hypothetical protein